MAVLETTFNLPPAPDKGLNPVFLTVKADDVATPHEVVFRVANGKVVDARTHDFGDGDAIPAETVETLLQKSGANLPTGNDEVVISFDPRNGKVIAVSPKPAGKKASTIH
ncbi:MAG: hypothetical protein ACKVRN_00620 [Pyrinomonadaceae bacterium]